MSKLETIDLAKRTRASEYHDRTRDMETALAWSNIKKVLILTHREELFEMIQSVKVTEKYITLSTKKPIVNAELSLLREDMLAAINLSFEKMSIPPKVRIRLV